ncbi:hypothetical protein BASA81_005890 [Batrachochytrium salamandrivorans]|nr:hypothetical protein BASA81_005890 [Batrachochytrium salamandrivorans]
MLWVWCVAVGAVWGLTNAMMKRADELYTREGGEVLLNLRWWLCFLANQSGSLLFYWLLSGSDMAMVVPICQATTLAFTCVGAYFLEEQAGDWRWTGLGLVLVSVGVGLMRDGGD